MGMGMGDANGMAVLQGFEGSAYCHLLDDASFWMKNMGPWIY